MKIIKIVYTVSFCVLLITQGYSKHLGIYGHTFVIGETNLLDLIHHRLKVMDASGELAKWQNAVIKQVKKSMITPPGTSVKTTRQPDVFYYTPEFILARDIIDATGKLLYQQGTRVNALDQSTYPKILQSFNPIPPFYAMKLIFINGNDKDQLHWAKQTTEKLNAEHANYKIVLTEGNLVQANKSLEHHTRFDQGGVLIQQLGIKAVPSIVEIDPKSPRLKITEIGVQTLNYQGVDHA